MILSKNYFRFCITWCTLWALYEAFMVAVYVMKGGLGYMIMHLFCLGIQVAVGTWFVLSYRQMKAEGRFS